MAFKCRVCGGKKKPKEILNYSKLIGGPPCESASVAAYACAECSVIFKNPKAFSVAPKPKSKKVGRPRK